MSLFKQIARHLPGLQITTAFDVGANVGQTIKEIREGAPVATIWAFEPIAAAFNELVQTAPRGGNVRCFNLALGSKPGTATMASDGTKTSNRIVENTSRKNVEEVALTTGDLFCSENRIDRISFLKIDTEGHDLEALLGFEGMLQNKRIDLVQVECGMNPTNNWHVPFARFTEYLEPMAYYLFQIFEQKMELKGKPILRRCNPVFISTETAERYWRRA